MRLSVRIASVVSSFVLAAGFSFGAVAQEQSASPAGQQPAQGSAQQGQQPPSQQAPGERREEGRPSPDEAKRFEDMKKGDRKLSEEEMRKFEEMKRGERGDQQGPRDKRRDMREGDGDRRGGEDMMGREGGDMMKGDMMRRDSRDMMRGDMGDRRSEGDHRGGENGDRMGEQDEERMKKNEERQLKNMKSRLKQQGKMVSQMQKRFASAEKDFAKCGIKLPDDVAKAFETASASFAKIEAATTMDDLEAGMGDFKDAIDAIQESQGKMGMTSEMCKRMLPQAEKELKRISDTKALERLIAKNPDVDFSGLLAEYTAEVEKLRGVLNQVRTAALTDPEDAMRMLGEEFFGGMEDVMTKRGQIEAVAQSGKGVKMLKKDLSRFQKQLSKLKKKEDVDVSALEDATNNLAAAIAEIEKLRKSKSEPEDMMAAFEDAFTAVEQGSNALDELGIQNQFMKQFSPMMQMRGRPQMDFGVSKFDFGGFPMGPPGGNGRGPGGPGGFGPEGMMMDGPNGRGSRDGVEFEGQQNGGDRSSGDRGGF